MSDHKHTKKARARLADMGYKTGRGHSSKHPDEKEDVALFKREIRKARIKLADGGIAEGPKPKHRADRRSGGKMGKGKAHVTVNVINAGSHPRPVPVPKPVPVPVPAGGPGMPPGAPPMGAGGPPMPEGGPPGMKRGGKVSARDEKGGMPMGHFRRGGKTRMTAGAGSGEGRIEKARMQKRK